MDKVTVDFQYEKKEYISAFRNYLFKSRIIHMRDLVLVGILLIFEILLHALLGFSIYTIVIGVILGFYIIIFLLLYFYQPVNVFRRSPKLRQPYTIIFAKENVQIKTKGASSVINWSNFQEIWDCSTFYYLIQAKNIYTIIPKRSFKSKDDLQAFDALLNSTGITLKKYR